jgi:hypothetical protein
MIDGIRRKLMSIDDDSLWDANLDLQPEVESTEIPTDISDLLCASRVLGEFSPNANKSDYYTGLVRAALAQGGRYGDLQISIPWLRNILAGLEWRNIEPEKLWEGVETSGLNAPSAQIPIYDKLFPSNGDIPSGPELPSG